MTHIGHNNGPTMEGGIGWRRHCWTKARGDLLGKRMPIEIVRMHVARAKDLGLDYKTYASVRNTTGRDIIAFLFSSNALRLSRSAADLPHDRGDQLRQIRDCGQIILAHRPIEATQLPPEFDRLHDIRLKDARPAPRFTDSWSQMRDEMRALLAAHQLPSDMVVLVGDTSFEHDWTAAGKLAGYLSADRYFPDQSGAR